MKKLVLLLSFVFVLGLISVSAQDAKKVVKKAPAKTEKAAKAPEKAKTPEKAPAKAKKSPKKVAAPVKK